MTGYTCETCKFWGEPDREIQELRCCDRADMLFRVSQWQKRDGNPVLAIDADHENHGMFVRDGSSYWAALFTRPTFGCVEFQAKDAG